MAVVVIISSMILRSPTVIVSVSFPLTVTVAIPVLFFLLVAEVTTTFAVSFSFTVPPVLTISVFFVLRRLLAFTAGGGPTVLRSFLLAKTFLLPFYEFEEGSTTSFFVFERLILAQVFKEWYRLKN